MDLFQWDTRLQVMNLAVNSPNQFMKRPAGQQLYVAT